MAQTSTDWKPNRRQKKLLDAAQEAGINRTISQVCQEADVPRRTFYNWLDKEGFAKAWDDVWRCAIVRHMPSVVAAMTGKARKGDVGAARLVADMAGAIKKQHEISGPEGKPIDIDVRINLESKLREAVDAQPEEGVSEEPE